MKRLLAILLSLSLLCLVVLAAACGDNPGDETTSGTTPSEQTSGTTGSDSPDETTGSGEETSGTDETTGSTGPTELDWDTMDPYAKPAGFEDVDFGGRTFVIAAYIGADGWESNKEIYSDETDSISVAVRQRNQVMEELYNCTIQVEATGAIGPLIEADRTSGTDRIKAYTVKYGGKGTAEDGANYNLYTLGINFENPWWDQTYVDTYSVRKNNGTMTLYTVIGDFALSSFSATHAIIVNKDVLATSPVQDDIYELVRNKEWTMDKFMEFIINTAQESSGNSELHWSEGDIMGWVRTAHATHGLHAASGLSIIENNDGVLSLAVGNHLTEWSTVMETAIAVWDTQGSETISYVDVEEALSSATTLFGSEVLDVLERMKDTENVSVGVLPYPLYSESQENYAHYVDNHIYAYAVPTSVSNPTVMGEFLEVYAFHSRYLVRPAWIDAYAYDYCSDADSAEMLEIILDTRTYDPGYLWWSQYESSFSGFISNDQNEVTRWNDRNAATIQNDINTFVEKISSREI